MIGRLPLPGALVPLQSDPFSGLEFDAGTVTQAVLVLAAAYLLARLVTAGLSAVAERAGDRRIAVKVFIPLARFVIYAVAVASVLGGVFRLTPAQLVAAGGLFGAVLGFGVKDLFASVIGGLVVVFERPYRVGDKVAIDGHYGEVTDVGLRATRLVTPDDTEVVVPNLAVFGNPVANANAGAAELLAVAEVHVAPTADRERAVELTREAALTSPYVRLSREHPVTVIVEDAPHYTTIKGKTYVADLRDEFRFTSDVTRRALAAFDEAGIERSQFAPAEHERAADE
ncbi:MAG: mechanosensitive ion channel family protein [Haloglomus sp.]